MNLTKQQDECWQRKQKTFLFQRFWIVCYISNTSEKLWKGETDQTSKRHARSLQLNMDNFCIKNKSDV